jgi:AcrR family transcriptional regulator
VGDVKLTAAVARIGRAFYSGSYRTAMARRGRPRTFDRDQAIDRAVAVFHAHGYDGTTIEDLQAAMGGITPPSFYAAFGSKEALFREVVERYRATNGAGGRRALTLPRVRDSIEALLRASLDAFCDPSGPRGCLLLTGTVDGTRANKDAHELLHRLRQQPPELIRKRLERAVADGELPPGLDLTGIASFYATVLHGLAIRARDGASRASLVAAVDGAMAAWKSLTTPARAPRRRRASRRPRR